MKPFIRVVALSLLLAGLWAVQSVAAGGEQAAALQFTGTIRHIDLEGGFWGIVADDGKQYDPLNLDAAYRRDGLRVRVEAIPRQRFGTHMWGTYIEILSISKEPGAGS